MNGLKLNKEFANDHQIYVLFARSFEHHYSVTKAYDIFSTVNFYSSKYFLNPLESNHCL